MRFNKVIVGGGLLGALVVAGAIYFYNLGATPHLEGKITEVRTLGTDQSSSVAFVNFEAVNSSNYNIFIGRREMEVIDGKDNRLQGVVVSVFDMQQLFKYYPALGGMKDEPLLTDQEVPPGETVRGLVAARFEIPKHEMDVRKELILHTVDFKGRKTSIRHVNE